MKNYSSNLLRRIAGLLFLLGAALALPRPCAATPLQWDFTGSLNTARDFHTATLLPSGKVLVVGGFDSVGLSASCELYDPATGIWTPTGSLHTPRQSHSATLLGNGLVLVAGGATDSTAELYDPAAGVWTLTGKLNDVRAGHLAALLPSGAVLVAGGTSPKNGHRLQSAEVYDPVSGTWSLTGSMNVVRYVLARASTVLPNGSVLVAGGYGNFSLPQATAEIYDPATGSWSYTGSLHSVRGDHTTTLLPNGMVLVAGGADSSFQPQASAEIYDPASGTWSVTGSLMIGHSMHTATLLTNGLVLLAGGQSFPDATAEAELFDPATGAWTPTGNLKVTRVGHTATLLTNGMVLAAAGTDGEVKVNSAELYDAGMPVFTQTSGRGLIFVVGGRASFSFHASLAGDRPSGSLTFSDPTTGVTLTNAKVRTLTINGNSADFGGMTVLGDGSKVTFSVSVTDQSTDGSSDTFAITLSNGYSAGGTLNRGDIVIQ